MITDESGDTAQVTITDVTQSKGVIHVVDTVLLPRESAALFAPERAAHGPHFRAHPSLKPRPPVPITNHEPIPPARPARSLLP